MKNIAILLLMILASCGKTEKKKSSEQVTASVQLGKTLFESTGNCASCHQPQQKVIGPSTSEIAKIYKDQNADIVAFLQEKSEPIVDPSQYEVMKTNFAITKKMSDVELKSLEMYINSIGK